MDGMIGELATADPDLAEAYGGLLFRQPIDLDIATAFVLGYNIYILSGKIPLRLDPERVKAWNERYLLPRLPHSPGQGKQQEAPQKPGVLGFASRAESTIALLGRDELTPQGLTFPDPQVWYIPTPQERRSTVISHRHHPHR